LCPQVQLWSVHQDTRTHILENPPEGKGGGCAATAVSAAYRRNWQKNTAMAAVTATTTTMVSTESVQDPPAITPFARRTSGSSSSSKEGSSDDGGGGSGRERTADLPLPSAISGGPLAARAATTQKNPVAPLPKWSSLQFWGTNGPGGEGGEGKVGDLAARDGAGDGGMYLG
ncbi:unnamed protein product, partial [Ectocarpus sp. 8 AP-2014]